MATLSYRLFYNRRARHTLIYPQAVTGMYIELFLIDNFLMDLLVLRLAEALASRRAGGRRLVLFALIGAALGWASLYAPRLTSLGGKAITGLALAFALPSRNAGEYALAFFAVMASAFAVGGAALALASAMGGGAGDGLVLGPVPLRAALLGAVLAAFMPAALRRARAVRRRARFCAKLELRFGGRDYAVEDAMVDTGNLLREPVSGLAVVLVKLPELVPAARVPVPAATAAGERMLYALRPERLWVDGVAVDAMVVPLEIMPGGSGALIPSSLFEMRKEDI